MELKATNHSYYCNDGNYFNSGSLATFDSWEEFKESWLNEDLSIDHDYNHCFRFDIKNKYDEETDEEYEDQFSLHLYMMLQRKGNFVPIYIKTLTKDDMLEVELYLKSCWEYMRGQWEEFSK